MNRFLSLSLSLAGLAFTIGAADAAVPAYRSAVLGDGAIAYYEFDEIAGVIAADTALTLGGANDGAILGGVTLNQTSAFPGLNTAFAFDGSTGRVRIPDHTIFDLGTGQFTVELWFMTSSATRGDLFTYKGGGGDFGIHSNSQAAPNGFTGSVSAYLTGNFAASQAGADLNTWHHVALTRGDLGAVSLFIDGTLRATGTDADTLNIAADLLIGTNFGANQDTPALSFNGLIDEVAIYPTALTQTQINNHIALAAVPEPSTLSMLALGVFGLVGRRRSAARR